MLEELGVVGVSWRQENSEALAGYALSDAGRTERLKGFAERAELDELAYLETCNRVELVFSQSSGGGARDLRPLAFELLAGRAPRPGEAERSLKAWRGEGACEHLLLVAAGLDSAALGEPEIVGQVRACRDDAADFGLIGPRLQVVFGEALRIAARVREETGLGRGRVSLAEIAVSRVLETLGDGTSTVALIGVSAMTRKVGRSLARKRVPLLVVNRTTERAAELAAELGGRSLALDDFLSRPPELDAIVASTGARTPLLTEPVLTRIAAVAPPGGKPLLVDLAVPGNIDGPACEALGLARIGMDEIVQAAQQNRNARKSEAASARQLVDEALPRVRRRLAERVYAPMYGALQEHYREVAVEGLNRLLDKELQGLGSTERRTVSTWAEGLARRLAHIPTRGVRGLLHHGPRGVARRLPRGTRPEPETPAPSARKGPAAGGGRAGRVLSAMRIRIGTRRSRLARTQAAGVAAALAERGYRPEIVPMETAGDRSPLASFGTIGAEGVFVRDIEESLLSGRIDVAVHSFKDLPSRTPAPLMVAAVPPRRDAADVLVLRRAAFRPAEPELPVIPAGTLGTASARRAAWIRELRPDLTVTHVRGNVPTRIGRVGEGLDGVVLAAAGVERLRESPLPDAEDPVPGDLQVHRLAPDRFVPAPAQGALAVQCRRDDHWTRAVAAGLDHAPSRELVEAERSLLARVEGGCETAFGAWCSASPDGLLMVAALERGSRVFRVRTRAKSAEAVVMSAWRGFERQWAA